MAMRRVAVLALLSLLPHFASLAAAPAAVPQKPENAKPPAGGLHGRVLDDEGKPVKQAVVRILAESTLRGRPQAPNRATRVETGQDGSFAAQGLAGAAFLLRVEARGYAPFTQKQVPAGASVRVGLRKGYPLSGVVRDLSTRKPIAGAVVLACDQDAAHFGDDACRRATSADDGRFLIIDLAQGAVEVEARAPGHALARLAGITVPQARAAEAAPSSGVELFLRTGGRLAGRVTGSDAKPIEGADLEVRPLERNLRDTLREEAPRPVSTDASGKFTFEGLPTGRYRLTASKKGFAPVEAGPYEVQPGTDRTNIEVRLETGATLKVRIVDAQERPVHGLQVEILDPKRARALRPDRQAVSDEQIQEGEDGHYTVVNLEPGTRTIRLLPGDWADVEREGTALKTGQTTDLGTIVVREGRSISGHVTDTTGAPIADAAVSAFWSDGSDMKTREGRTGVDGRYRIAGLGESPVRTMRVRASGYANAERDGATPGDTAVDFVLERTGGVVGRVELTGGKVPVAFRVTAHPEARESGGESWRRLLVRDEGQEQVFTDPTGAFRLDDLDPGSYTLEAHAGHYAPAKKTGIVVRGDQVTDAGTLTLELGIALHGRVLDAKNDSPVAGAAIRIDVPQSLPLRFDRAAAPPGSAVSAMDGAFTIDGLQAGAYVVTVEHPEFSPSRGRVEFDGVQEPPEFVARMSRGGTLTGLVLDAQRQPVAQARILVTQGMGEDLRTVATGPDGRYIAERLVPATYQVMRQPDGASGFVPGYGMKTAVVRDGETTTLDFDEASKVVLTGRVLKGEAPLSDTMLQFRVGDVGSPAEVKTTQSDADGAYRIGLDHGGVYQVTVQPGSTGELRGQSSVRLNVPEQAEVEQDIVLPANSISGRVSDPDGKGISGAFVAAFRDGAAMTDPSRQLVGQSDPEGTFRLDGVQPGAYRVSARAPGYRLKEMHPVEVSEAVSQPTVDFQLERGLLLRGRVVDPQDRAVANAMVFVAPAGSPESALFLPSQTDVNGAFELTAPADGPVDLTAVSSAWSPARLAGLTPPAEGDPTEVRLQATLGGKLLIQLSGADGQPIVGVPVLLRPLPSFPGSEFAINGPRRPGPTGPDGTVLVTMLAPGITYEVSLPGRRNVSAVQVLVTEGTESVARFTLP